MNIKLFNPVPIAKIQVESLLVSKIDQLSIDLFSSSSTVEDYPVNQYLTIRGGEQRRVWPCKEDRTWLTNWIESQAREYQESAGMDLVLVPKVSNCWTITQPENSYQVTHTHPYGNISGNLYLEIPDFKSDSAETDGCISFLFDPSSDPTATRFVHIAPTVGTMLIFPSWLPHQVYPWQGFGNRRVLAWDCQLLPQ
jgi:Putative 2OG-Fe(II) oxygenase